MTSPAAPDSILVIDIGTSSVRFAQYRRDDVVRREMRVPFPPQSPADGLVEFNAAHLARLVLDGCHRMIEQCGRFVGVGIANQRGSTILWDRRTGVPVAPALGWQDLRTIGLCFEMGAKGHRFAPNQTATKATALWDGIDPDRQRDLCVGTVDSWVAWVLSNGSRHITERSNAAISGMLTPDTLGWAPSTLADLRIPEAALPTLMPSWGELGVATALPGSPPILAMLGDQQASMLGQGCVSRGDSKMTFGTGGMFDMFLGTQALGDTRSRDGCFPIVCWAAEPASPTAGVPAPQWGAEGILLAAGSAVDWLCEGLGLAPNPAATAEIAASVDTTDGVVFVPSLQGEGTPGWDFGARGTLLGLSRGTTRAHITRAVLEGVAFAADAVVRAASTDAELPVAALRVDGGMSVNPTFVQLVADATGLVVYPSPVVEATTLGAGRAAALALGWFGSTEDIARQPITVDAPAPVEPGSDPINRTAWAEAAARSQAWYPELSAIQF